MNLRPAKIYAGLESFSPLKPEICEKGFDTLIVRELTGGLYFAKHPQFQGKARETIQGIDYAWDIEVYSIPEIERIAHQAFKLAQSHRRILTSIDKANVMISSVMWRETINTMAQQYPTVKLNHIYIDNATMQLMIHPEAFDVVLCNNIFGDIISDQAAQISGSIGLLPSASINESSFGLYEPSGSSAPDIAGQNKANPIAQILSLAMLLRYSLNQSVIADQIEQAVNQTLTQGHRTSDLTSDRAKAISTTQMGQFIIDNFNAI